MPSWTAPRTFVALELETATIFNVHLRDNLLNVRGVLLGTEDLGANMLLASGRSFYLSATGVGHGMTDIVPTTVYGAIGHQSATAGGLNITGLSDTAGDRALALVGRMGDANPTVPVIVMNASKKNGTTVQALAASEIGIGYAMGGSFVAYMYGSGGMAFTGGLAVGYALAAPTPGLLTIGDANFILQMAGTVATIKMDAANDSGIHYDRVSGQLTLQAAGTPYLTISPTLGVYLASSGNGLGLALGTATGALSSSIKMAERATDPFAPDADELVIFAKDNGAGKTALYVRFSSGAVQGPLATQP